MKTIVARMAKFMDGMPSWFKAIALFGVIVHGTFGPGVSIMSMVGCATVTPPVTPAAQTPVGNGGILSGAKGGPFRLTGEEHARFNALVAIWGTKGGFLPPLVPNAGISAINATDGSCLIDGEHMVDLILMQAYQDGRAKP